MSEQRAQKKGQQLLALFACYEWLESSPRINPSSTRRRFGIQ